MERDPTDLAGQQEQKRERDARKRLARETEIGDVRWLMSSRKGRRIAWRWMEVAGVFCATFDRNAMQMAFNEGSRSFGNQMLYEIMKLCPEMFPVMMKEQNDGNADGTGAQSN